MKKYSVAIKDITHRDLVLGIRTIFEDLDHIMTTIESITYCNNCGILFKDIKSAKKHEKLCVTLNPKRKKQTG